MLDLSKYQSIGAALKDALEEFSGEVCLIESDREREKERLTYRDFKERAHFLAKALQDAGFKGNHRAAIIMTNQSKWLISAYAIFHSGGVLVPLDYKLTPDEQWQLLKHSSASVLITEYPIWRQLVASPLRNSATNLKTVLVTETPPNADLSDAHRWEEFRSVSEPAFIPRQRSDIETALAAKPKLEAESGLIVMDCDLWFRSASYNQMVEDSLNNSSAISGGLLTFTADNPRYSYAKFGDDGIVTETAEKRVISEHAITGAYYFATARTFIDAAEELLSQPLTETMPEYYLSFLYNILINEGRQIKAAVVDEFASFGTPEELADYSEHL